MSGGSVILAGITGMHLSYTALLKKYANKQWTIYSATTFLEKCKKVVQEIWFDKNGSRKMVDQKKRWFYTINPHFFRLEKSG